MLIKINSITKEEIQNYGTNSAFPDGEIPNLPELSENEEYIKIDDNSDLAKKILDAHEYNLVFKSKKIKDIEVIKTKKQHEYEVFIKQKNDKQKIKEDYNKIDKKDLESRLKFIEKTIGLGGE